MLDRLDAISTGATNPQHRGEAAILVTLYTRVGGRWMNSDAVANYAVIPLAASFQGHSRARSADTSPVVAVTAAGVARAARKPSRPATQHVTPSAACIHSRRR